MSHLKFGAFIKLKRKGKFNGNYIAEKADVTRTTLFNIESGKHVPGLDVAMKILSALGEDLGSFFEYLKDHKEIPVTQIEMNPKKYENYSTDLPCLVCMRQTENGNTFHHVISQKSLGPDEDWNLMPLCLEHHNEVHTIGRSSFAKQYFTVKVWLESHGWECDSLTGKWRHQC